jgi:transposase
MQDSGHTPEWTGQTVERLMRNGKRIFTSAFKAWLVEQAGKPGTSVAGLALRHGVNANQLRRWMRLAKQYVTERAPVLLPVYIEQAQVPATPAVPAPASSAAASPIEIEVAGAVVRVYEGVDAHRLRMVLDALRA